MTILTQSVVLSGKTVDAPAEMVKPSAEKGGWHIAQVKVCVATGLPKKLAILRMGATRTVRTSLLEAVRAHQVKKNAEEMVFTGLVSALPFAAGMMKKHATTIVGTPLHAPPSIKVDALVPKARRNAGASMAFQDFVPSFAAGMMRKRATTMLENRTLALPSMMVDAHAPKAKQNAQEHLVGLDIAPHFAVRNSLVTILIPGNQNPVRLGKKDVPLIPSMHLTW
mmetsp:Transcript_23383/g.48946  ORF Transcript_23383/g.48946 Transcript_23383/m.48946 type:complete len:224 (+) Transcript_23383:333-1004(+)